MRIKGLAGGTLDSGYALGIKEGLVREDRQIVGKLQFKLFVGARYVEGETVFGSGGVVGSSLVDRDGVSCGEGCAEKGHGGQCGGRQTAKLHGYSLGRRVGERMFGS